MEKGYPCIFYGDYYGTNGDKSRHQPIIDLLLDARRKYAYGEQKDYFDHPSTVGFVRLGDKDHPGSGLVFLMSNGIEGNKIMNVGINRKGEVWYDITGNVQKKITIDDEGNGDFLVEGGALSVWVKS